MKTIQRVLYTSLVASLFFSSFALFAKESDKKPAPSKTERAELIVAATPDHPPFSVETANKELVGFDIDLMKAIAKKMNLPIKIMAVPWISTFSGLERGDIDIVISGVVINDRRRQYYEFTQPVFEGNQTVTVKKDAVFKEFRDLSGKRIGVITNSAGEQLITRYFGRSGAEIIRYQTLSILVEELSQGRIDALIFGNAEVREIIKTHAQLRQLPNASFPREFRGFAVSWGNEALLDKLNSGIDAIKADGTYAKIYKTWFDAPVPNLPKQAGENWLEKEHLKTISQ